MRQQFLMPPELESLAPQPDRIGRETVQRVITAAMFYSAARENEPESPKVEYKVASYGTPGTRGHRYFTTEQSHRRFKAYRMLRLVLRAAVTFASIVLFMTLDHEGIIYALGTWWD